MFWSLMRLFWCVCYFSGFLNTKLDWVIEDGDIWTFFNRIVLFILMEFNWIFCFGVSLWDFPERILYWYLRKMSCNGRVCVFYKTFIINLNLPYLWLQYVKFIFLAHSSLRINILSPSYIVILEENRLSQLTSSYSASYVSGILHQGILP